MLLGSRFCAMLQCVACLTQFKLSIWTELESAFKARKMYDFGFNVCVEIKELSLFRPGTRDQGDGETAQL